MVLGLADEELGVQVAHVGGVHRLGGLAHGVLGVLVVDVHRRDLLQRHRARDPHGAVVEIGAQGDVLEIGRDTTRRAGVPSSPRQSSTDSSRSDARAASVIAAYSSSSSSPLV